MNGDWVDRAADTKKRILDAARAEFAERGIAGARVDTIAAEAHINKQRIYAYFGNKNQLFAAVLADAFNRLAEAVPLPRSRQELVEYASRVFDFHRQNPDFNRLLAWEALTFRGSVLPGEAERRKYYFNKIRVVAELFPDISEDTIASMLFQLIGLAAWPVLMIPLQRHLHGLEPDVLPSESSTRQFITQSAAALIDGFIPSGELRLSLTDLPNNC